MSHNQWRIFTTISDDQQSKQDHRCWPSFKCSFVISVEVCLSPIKTQGYLIYTHRYIRRNFFKSVAEYLQRAVGHAIDVCVHSLHINCGIILSYCFARVLLSSALFTLGTGVVAVAWNGSWEYCSGCKSCLEGGGTSQKDHPRFHDSEWKRIWTFSEHVGELYWGPTGLWISALPLLADS